MYFKAESGQHVKSQVKAEGDAKTVVEGYRYRVFPTRVSVTI